MMCTECNKNHAQATVIKIINGHRIEMSLCPSCLRKLEQYEREQEQAFMSPFPASFLGLSAESERACVHCRTTLSEFKKTGYLGCERCYEEFAGEVERMLEKVQGSITHVGKIPKGKKREFMNMREYERLSADLKSAVSEERYEDAARIKLKLKKIMDR